VKSLNIAINNFDAKGNIIDIFFLLYVIFEFKRLFFVIYQYISR